MKTNNIIAPLIIAFSLAASAMYVLPSPFSDSESVQTTSESVQTTSGSVQTTSGSVQTNSWSVQTTSEETLSAEAIESLKEIQALLNQGINARDSSDNTALMLAAKGGHTATALALIEKGAALDLQNMSGRTALMEAARNVQTEIGVALIEKGASINVQTGVGYTALTLVLLYGNEESSEELALKLLEAGADPSIPTGSNRTARDYTSNKAVIKAIDERLKEIAAPLKQGVQERISELPGPG